MKGQGIKADGTYHSVHVTDFRLDPSYHICSVPSSKPDTPFCRISLQGQGKMLRKYRDAWNGGRVFLFVSSDKRKNSL